MDGRDKKMGLKITSRECIKYARKFLAGATVITIVVMTAVLFWGCTPPIETRQMVIPSELEPEAVLPDLGGQYYQECVYEVGKDTDTCQVIQHLIEADELGNGFVDGYSRGYWTYILKNGKEIGVFHTLLDIDVLKYESPSAAQQAISLFSERTSLKDVIFEGVNMKWKRDSRDSAVYMVRSDDFLILVLGWNEPCKDALSRIVQLYSVPINKST
jgi:hypothetical protein